MLQNNQSQAATLSPKSLVWFITGCSSGFGRALAEAAIARGHQVVATARDVGKVQDLEETHPGQALALPLDVTRVDKVQDAVSQAVKTFGHIDVLANNAGFGMIGAVEEVSDAEVRRLFDTNVFGLLNVTRAVLPHMRSRRSGHILNMSSVGGLVSVVGSGIYCASKFAVEGLSEALAQELQPLGIRVTVVEPGPFRTKFAGDSLTKVPAMEDYAVTVGKRRQQVEAIDGNQPGDPVRAAQAIIQVVEDPNPPLHLVLGKSAVQSVRSKLDSVAQELNAWESISVATDYPNREAAGS